jgi:hypothetical protein
VVVLQISQEPQEYVLLPFLMVLFVSASHFVVLTGAATATGRDAEIIRETETTAILIIGFLLEGSSIIAQIAADRGPVPSDFFSLRFSRQDAGPSDPGADLPYRDIRWPHPHAARRFMRQTGGASPHDARDGRGVADYDAKADSLPKWSASR